MSDLIQSKSYDIGSMPQNKANLGIPLLSNTYIGVSNSGFKYSDLVYKRADDSLTFDMNNALSKMRPENLLLLNLNTDLLSFGFKIKHTYVGFNVTEKFTLQLNYRKDLIDFLWNGNGPSIGQTREFNTNFDYSHYREYGVIFIRNFGEKISAGLKFNFLQGFENLSTVKTNLSLKTDPKFYELTAQSDILINQSGRYKDIFNKDFKVVNYLFNPKNFGYSIDFGAHYKLTEKVEFSLSLNDFGKINWSQNVYNLTSNNPEATYTYKGLYLANLINDTTTINNAFNQVLDSAYSSFKIDTTHQNYSTKLAKQVYLGANYKLNDVFKANLLLYGRFYEKAMQPGVSVAMDAKLTRAIHLSVSYSIFNKSYNNLGFGLSLSAKKGTQFYVITDNIIGAIFPQNAKSTNIRFGMNIKIGAGSDLDDEDGDGIFDIDDKCPKMKGSIEMKGCPDSDNDKVADFEDQCPDDYGVARLKGCPDRDGDNIIDKFDKCPDVPGVQRFQGCPDTDEDGVKDIDDECPDIKGLSEFKGCPDTDGDGIKDSDDKCPNDFGKIENGGCPLDTDKDGVFDTEDLCPDVAGKKENKGCPDKDIDGDGIIDREDQCPNSKGLLSNNGCPVLLPEEELIIKVAQENIEFEQSKEILKSTSYAPLDRLAILLKTKLELNLKISVFTDNSGSETFSMTLTKDRADILNEYLMAKGIDRLRIETTPFGSTKSIADNNTEGGRNTNNRVEITPFFK